MPGCSSRNTNIIRENTSRMILSKWMERILGENTSIIVIGRFYQNLDENNCRVHASLPAQEEGSLPELAKKKLKLLPLL